MPPEYPGVGKHDLQEKKQNGIYYTPDLAAQILTRWAIRQPTDIVLEPSFGGCGFLTATRDRLLEIGNKQPQDRLYGCDID
ncbi:N-6 DNA Methylase [Hymenobacter psychrotolerans DSM 18569]|uniref:N-6 DNA Methylase n=1 Tax=Hymenobacter psychrotolerans DSM 18569 TaxID=1121959 RepID=A0A1M7F4J2_9BACT|nr:N-6 DNA Methylase [Hymenobacter psychrotolerans DSM 18569]